MKTKKILDLMNVLTWIIFIGLCIKTGALIITFIISLFINPEAAENLYLGLDLSELYNKNIWYFINTMSFMLVLSGLKAYLFYVVIKIFLKMNLKYPFNAQMEVFILNISYIALGIGILSILARNYTKWLLHRGISIAPYWESSSFLFLAGVIFVIALVFKRGIEMQSENELTT